MKKDIILMPCGSNISCLDCINYIMQTRDCYYIDKLSEDDKIKFDNELHEKYEKISR
jgi:hypothetical protein